jgi:NAD(P)-dependent dehydrogenase (short-subunit alcohol dehydrogenase family)
MTATEDREGVCVVLGVGPSRGLGAALCRAFARAGATVVAAGRTRERLEAVAEDILQAGGRAEAVVCDATDEDAVRALFDRAAEIGPLGAAIYNVGNNRPGAIAEMETAYFERAWRIGCLGGFLFGREAVRRWQGETEPAARRSLLFTGASASLRGRAGFGAFAAAKGALRQLAQSLAREHGPDGIHVAHVVVDGGIAGDKIEQGAPEFAQRVGPDGLIDLDGLANAYRFLHGQEASAWTFELDLRTAQERW